MWNDSNPREKRYLQHFFIVGILWHEELGVQMSGRSRDARAGDIKIWSNWWPFKVWRNLFSGRCLLRQFSHWTDTKPIILFRLSSMQFLRPEIVRLNWWCYITWNLQIGPTRISFPFRNSSAVKCQQQKSRHSSSLQPKTQDDAAVAQRWMRQPLFLGPKIIGPNPITS